MSDEQSTVKFLLSKEGRGILVGTIILVAVVGVVGVFTYNSLFGSDDPRQDSNPQRDGATARAGETRIKASSSDIRTNSTSQNLNTEARGALDQYNDQADEFGLMPIPTPDNVSLVPVVPSSSTGGERTPAAGSAPSNIATDGERSRSAAQQRSTLTPDEIKAERERMRASESVLVEHRSARLEAAYAVLATYQEPPASASFAFSSVKDASQKDTGDLDRVSRNDDGTAGFIKGSSGRSGNECSVPLIKGGQIRYAQTDIALNTDFQGPVRMTFLDGKIAGYTGMGSFELNELGAKMKLKINTLFDPDGQQYSVSGYVLDPNTTLWAMASDVDRHIIYRYGGFGLGTILSSFAILADNRAKQSEIITPEGAQSTTYRDPDGKQVTWTVLGEFSRLFEEAFKDNLNRPITVTLEPNEEAGVLFENTVCELDTKITRDRKEAELKAQAGFSDPIIR